jgi:hypothetical protein
MKLIRLILKSWRTIGTYRTQSCKTILKTIWETSSLVEFKRMKGRILNSTCSINILKTTRANWTTAIMSKATMIRSSQSLSSTMIQVMSTRSGTQGKKTARWILVKPKTPAKYSWQIGIWLKTCLLWAQKSLPRSNQIQDWKLNSNIRTERQNLWDWSLKIGVWRTINNI